MFFASKHLYYYYYYYYYEYAVFCLSQPEHQPPPHKLVSNRSVRCIIYIYIYKYDRMDTSIIQSEGDCLRMPTTSFHPFSALSDLNAFGIQGMSSLCRRLLVVG